MPLDIVRVWEVVASVMVASTMGLARVLYKNGKRKLNIKYVISELIIAGISGFAALSLGRALVRFIDWPQEMNVILEIYGGWKAPQIIESISGAGQDVTNQAKKIVTRD